MASISKKLQRWALQAIDLGFGCFSDGDHSPLILLIDETKQRKLIDLKSLSGVTDAKLIERGREIIRSFDSGQLYGLVWDGYLIKGGVKQDAVCVEAGARGGTTAFVFAQPYTRKRRSGTLERVGKPLVASDAANLWKRTADPLKEFPNALEWPAGDATR